MSRNSKMVWALLGGLVSTGMMFAGECQAAAYSIAPGDVLAVAVYRQDDMNYRLRVDSEGFIRFPVAGRLHVAGISSTKIENTIAAALRKHGYSNPDVVVSVESYAPRTVFVMGAVKTPSLVTIPEGSEMTAMQAVSAAGGLTDEADADQVAVRRKNGSATQLLKVAARGILNGKDNAADTLLRPGDTVVVPVARSISVLGAVKSPGQFFATPEAPLTVARVLAMAGGVERPNSLSEIRVTRGKKSFKVNVRTWLESGKDGNDMTLNPGDIVYVPETRW